MNSIYVNNNNSRSDDYTFVTETKKNFKYKEQTSFPKSVNVDYNCDNETVYVDKNNIKPHSTFNPKMNTYNSSTPYINAVYGREIHSTKPNCKSSNHKPDSPPKSAHLNPSDDEALENYLNDLAKNYDDIDRRIRDAERFVSQIEEAQTSNFTEIVKSTKSANNKNTPNHSISTKTDEVDNSNPVKYITELRVNIADNGVTQEENNRYKDFKTKRSHNTFNSVIPIGRKTSLVSIANTPTFQSNRIPTIKPKFASSKIPTQPFLYEPRFNNRSVTDDSTNESNHKTEYENDFLIPPPQLYVNNPYYDDLYVNKEVQTNDYCFEKYCANRIKLINYDKQIFRGPNLTTSVEERSVQTSSPYCCTIKATVDTGVNTDEPYYPRRRNNSKYNYQSSIDTESGNPENSESETTPPINKKLKNRSKKVLRNQTDTSASSESNLSQTVTLQPTKKHSKHHLKKPNNSGDKRSLTSNDDELELKKRSFKKSRGKSSYSMRCNSPRTRPVHQKMKSKSINTSPKYTNLSKTLNDNTYPNTINNRRTFNHLLDSIPIDHLATKDLATQNASFEIQRLLENLGNHLQATINKRDPRLNMSGQLQNPTNTTDHFQTNSCPKNESTTFWDNPLQTSDMEIVKTWNKSNNKACSLNKPKPKKLIKKATPHQSTTGKASNINSELEAICKSIDKDRPHYEDKNDATNKFIRKQSVLRNRSTKSSMSNCGKHLGSGDQSFTNLGSNHTSATPNNNGQPTQTPTQQQLQQQLCNYKITKTFELSPYDDLIKSHLSPFDRRVKAVAAKNGCRIVIDGPINIYDPSSCQAYRNKVTYRCVVASQSKENLDKCMNYLKETFPNTFLRTNQRSH